MANKKWFPACSGCAPYERSDLKLATGAWLVEIRHSQTQEILFSAEGGKVFGENRARQWLTERLGVDKALGRPWAK